MPKKPITGLLSAAAFLTLACLCCPTGVFPFLQTPTAVPPTKTIPPTPTTTLTPSPTLAVESTPFTGDISACTDNLAQVLREAENVSLQGPEFQREYVLVTYTVSGNSLEDPLYIKPLPADLESYQNDIASQREMWQFVIDIIPADQRTLVAEFVVFTDGAGNSLGAVEQADDPHFWKLEMDIADAQDFPTLSTTLIHELGHLLTLNDTQIATSFRVLAHPDDRTVYDQEVATCPTLFTFEGCSTPDSYINIFFDRFWPEIYDEWQVIDAEVDEETFDQKLDVFYQKYADQFVSDYAVTSPEEDIAESFMYFIFTPEPSGASIADDKILFFYDYPELTDLRQRILAHLCNYVNNGQ